MKMNVRTAVLVLAALAVAVLLRSLQATEGFTFSNAKDGRHNAFQINSKFPVPAKIVLLGRFVTYAGTRKYKPYSDRTVDSQLVWDRQSKTWWRLFPDNKKPDKAWITLGHTQKKNMDKYKAWVAGF